MKEISEKLFLFFIPLLFLFPFFKENISTFFFILVALNTGLYSYSTKSYRNFDFKVLYLTLPFWIITVFSLLRMELVENLVAINHALFFLLFPVVFSLIPKEFFSGEKVNLYLTLLKNTCLIIAVSYVVAFLYKYDFSDFFVYQYNIPKFRDFVYSEIPFFRIHPTYYSSMVIVCTAFSFKKVLEKKAYFELIYVAAFLLITFLLLSKINILFLLALLICMPLTLRHFNLKQKVMVTVSFLLLGSILAFSIPGVKNRFVEMYNSYNNPPKGLSYDSTNVRLSITKCSIELAKEHYLFGVGFGELQERLDECYTTNYDSDFFVTIKYMTHNYFLYILISAGIFALLFFLFYCYKVFRMVLKVDQFLLYVMTLNILIICFTEDFFYRHYGIFFFHLILMTFVRNDAFRKDNTLNEVKNQED